MESIDKLREYVHGNCATENERAILRMADAIEREVEDNARFRAEAEPFHDRLCEAAEAREDVTLWGVDYTALPVDADGEPVHVGDVMETKSGKRFEVRFFTLNSVEWLVNSEGWWPAKLRHYHKPTVEDVLREFAAQVTNGQHIHGAIEIEQAIAECAAKLTLRGDE